MPSDLILESDALLITQHIDAMPEAEKAKAADILKRYRIQQEAGGAPLFPTMIKQQVESREKLWSAFDDPKVLDKENGVYAEADRLEPGLGDNLRASELQARFLAQQYGKPVQAVRDQVEFFATDYSVKAWKEPVQDPVKFAARAKVDALKQRDENVLYEGPGGLLEAALTHGLESDRFALNAWAEWSEANKGKPGYSDTANLRYREQALRLHNQARERRAVLKPIADKVRKFLEFNFTDGPDSPEMSPDIGSAIAELQSLKPDDYEMVKLLIQKGAKPVEKGMAQAAGEEAGRMLTNIARGGRDVFRKTFLALQETAAEMATDTVAMISEDAKKRGLDEEAKLARARRSIEIEEDLWRIATGDIDPNTKPGDSIWRKIAVGGSGAIASSAPFVLGGAGVAAMGLSYINDAEVDLRAMQEAKGIRATYGERMAYAVPVGVVQGALDKIGADFVLGLRSPLLRGTTAKITEWIAKGSISARALKRGAVGVVGENITEGLQDLTPILARDIANAISEKYPDVNYGEEVERWKDQRGDVFLAILPMSLLGMGVSIKNDQTLAQHFRDELAMRAHGIKREAIAQIQANDGNLAAQQAIFKTAWEDRGAPDAEAIAKLEERSGSDIQATATMLEVAQRQGYTLRRDGEGWQLSTPDGATVKTASAQEAVGLMQQDFSEGELRNAQAVADMADVFLDQKRGGERIEVQPGQSRDIQDDVAEGRISPEQARQAIVVAGRLAGLTEEESMQQIGAVLGSSNVEENEGVREAVGRIYQGGDAMTVVEETIEGRWKKGLLDGRYTAEQGAGWVRMAEQATGESYLPADGHTERELVEAISYIVRADVMGRRKDGKRLGAGVVTRGLKAAAMNGNKEAGKFSAFLSAFRQLFKRIFSTARKLQKARAEGKISEDFDNLLDDLLGIDAQTRYEAETAKMASDWVDEAGLTYTPADGETFSISNRADWETPQMAAMRRNFENRQRMDGVLKRFEKDWNPLFATILNRDLPLEQRKRALAKFYNRPFNKDAEFPSETTLAEMLGYTEEEARAMREGGETFSLGRGLGDLLGKPGAGAPGLFAPRKTAPSGPTLTRALLDQAEAAAKAVPGWQRDDLEKLFARARNLLTQDGNVEVRPTDAVTVPEGLGKIAAGEDAALVAAQWAQHRNDYVQGKTQEASPWTPGLTVPGKAAATIRDSQTVQTSPTARLRTAYRQLDRKGQGYVRIPDLARAAGLTPEETRGVLAELDDSGQAYLTPADEPRDIPEADRPFLVNGPSGKALFVTLTNQSFSLARRNLAREEIITPENKVAPSINGKLSADIFAEVKKRHGVTRSIYEAGYVLPDGTMLDFSGRADAGGFKQGSDLTFKVTDGRDWMKDQRGVDHREIEWQDMPNYKETWEPMVAFLSLGAVRVDANSGMISMHSRTKITAAQASALRSIVVAADGAYIDLEDDAGNRSSMQLNGGKWGKVNGLLTRWANGETPEYDGPSFSLAPRNLAALADTKMAALMKKPELKEALFRVARERLTAIREDQRTGYPALVGYKDGKPVYERREAVREGMDKQAAATRTEASLKQEARFMRQLRERELVDEGMGQLTSATILTYERGVEALSDDPFIAAMLAKGKLMSRTTAEKAGKLKTDGTGVAGDYNGAPSLPPSFYGGTIMPTEMADALYKEGALNDAYPDTLWDKLRTVIDSRRKDNEAFNKAREAVREVEKQAKEQAAKESEKWLQEARAKVPTEKERQMQSLRILDAILSAFPPEVRGRVGGFVKLASLGTDKAREAEIGRRLDKLEVELEKFAKKHFTTELDKLLAKVAPKGGGGEKAMGKIGVAGHRWFEIVGEALPLTEQQAQDEMVKLEAILSDAEREAEHEAALERWGILHQFGGFREKSSAEMETALETARDVASRGREAWKAIMEERKAARVALQQAALTELGGKAGWSKTQGKAAKESEKGQAEKFGDFFRRHLSFTQALQRIFGRGPTAQRYENAARAATRKKTDAMVARIKDFKSGMMQAVGGSTWRETQAKLYALQELQSNVPVRFFDEPTTKTLEIPGEIAARLADGTMTPKAAGLTDAEAASVVDEWAKSDNRNRVFEVKQRTPGAVQATNDISQNQAIHFTMLAKQENYREAMDRHGITAETLEDLEKWLTPEAKAVRSWLFAQYEAGYGSLNEVYKRMFGIDLPRVREYAPGYFEKEGASTAVDPFGSGVETTGLAAGFLKKRKNHMSRPEQVDALQAYWQHTQQTEHWKAWAELTGEMRSVLGNKEVMRTVKAKAGSGAAADLSNWIDILEQNGVKDAQSNAVLAKVMRAQARTALAFKLGVLMKQLPATLGSLSDIGAKEWISSARRVLSGQSVMSAQEMFNTPTIQRRIESGYSPEMRVAMQGPNAKPDGLGDVLEWGMERVAWTDAAFTSFSAAVAFDAHYQAALSTGLNDAEARKVALEQTENTVGRTAQPGEVMDRSLVELQTQGFGKLMFMFQSAQRQAWALVYANVSGAIQGQVSKSEAAKVVFTQFVIIPAITQTMSGLIRYLFTDDEPEEAWKVEDYLYAMMLGPSSGIMFAGAALDVLGSAYAPRSNNPLSGAASDVKRLLMDMQAGRDVSAKDIGSAVTGIAILLSGYVNPSVEAAGVTWSVLKQALGLAERAGATE